MSKKCFFRTMLFLFVLIFACGCHPFHGHCAENASEVVIIPVGDMKVLAIKDADVTFEKKLFPELKKIPSAANAFANGSLPGVDRVYYFDKGDKKILVDSGWGQGKKVSGKSGDILARLGIKPQDITDILLTHMDIDHIGGLMRKGAPAFPNAVLWVSDPELEAWKKGAVNRSAEPVELARSVIAAYDGRIKTFAFGEEIIPGVTPRDASGHTPGHTVWDINSGKGRLTIAGDLVHGAPLQLEHPQLSSVYDMDGKKAAASRENELARASENNSTFGGMHFSKIGKVIKRAAGGYEIEQ